MLPPKSRAARCAPNQLPASRDRERNVTLPSRADSIVDRRAFLKQTAVAAAGLGPAHALLAAVPTAVTLVLDPADPVAASAPVRWAVAELDRALSAHGIRVRHRTQIAEAGADRCILITGDAMPLARQLLRQAGVVVPTQPEALALVTGHIGGRPVSAACGADSRGLVYALLELADRVQHTSVPLASLPCNQSFSEAPANAIRSVTRCFQSDVEDLPWYHDRAMWPRYLAMLATQRFNRFNLCFGLGYDFPRNITDAYFHFTYPFLVAVPGYDVRAVGLPDAERERNLETLRFISQATADRGLDFHIGLWTHAYQWRDSPNANYTIAGLTPATHAAYCRDALRTLLTSCPAISGVTLRIHGESGVPEGSYDFWNGIFDGVTASGRRVELNLHAKGIDQKMITLALDSGQPVTVSPKYWAEHMGLPYQQASIRQLEMPRRDAKTDGFFALSSGSRSFMRYGYGDLLRDDRRYGVLFRIWPGTQRALQWGDPVTAAGFGRFSSFCGSQGVDLFEPLSFKGRRGSGLAGGRCAYADAALEPRHDWEKFLYTYRVWGRHLYNPDADPDTWRRLLRQQFRAAAPAAEAALAQASRILPLVTVAHGASAANNAYWPEMYTNMSLGDAAQRQPYGDTPSPKVFGNVSPFDPELFSRVNDFAGELLDGRHSGKHSPLEVAQWLEDLAENSTRQLAAATTQNPGGVEFRRLAIDVRMQCGLGRFFAWKLRSGVLFGLHEQAGVASGDASALHEALLAYRRARAAWAEVAEAARGIYRHDVTYGPEPFLRGHWADRLPAIDADVADIERRVATTSQAPPRTDGALRRAVQEVLQRPQPTAMACRHVPPPHFAPGAPLAIQLSLPTGRPEEVRIHYRHVDQAEAYVIEVMQGAGEERRITIPGAYTASPYALQYFFELRTAPEATRFYPGFEPTLSNQPYFVVPRV
ncbi:MAG: hypothetical protein ACYC6M_01710 [Terriglobales bacterium]